MPKKDFSYYEKQLRDCADLEGLKEMLNKLDEDFYEDATKLFNGIKQKRIEMLNGLLQSIGKTPF